MARYREALQRDYVGSFPHGLVNREALLNALRDLLSAAHHYNIIASRSPTDWSTGHDQDPRVFIKKDVSEDFADTLHLAQHARTVEVFLWFEDDGALTVDVTARKWRVLNSSQICRAELTRLDRAFRENRPLRSISIALAGVLLAVAPLILALMLYLVASLFDSRMRAANGDTDPTTNFTPQWLDRFVDLIVAPFWIFLLLGLAIAVLGAIVGRGLHTWPKGLTRRAVRVTVADILHSRVTVSAWTKELVCLVIGGLIVALIVAVLHIAP